MQDYNFWHDTLFRFNKKDCPNCGKKMGARQVAPHNQTLYLCSGCILAIDVEYDTVKKPKRIGNIRSSGKNVD